MNDKLRDGIRRTYAAAIKSKSCCGGGATSCCAGSEGATAAITGGLYEASELDGLPEDLIRTSFGCGNPTALSELHQGEVVLDLGSGAGLDVLLSAKRVGPSGRAYGLDMTDEMLEEAQRNQRKAGIANAEFIKGHLEDIPLPSGIVDVIISNCVINLSVDKAKALEEAYRVLRPGGRLAISDIVLMKGLPERLKESITAWAGCIAGAMTHEAYVDGLSKAGFADITIEVTRTYDFTDEMAKELLPGLSKHETLELQGAITSAFVRAHKPL